MRTKTVIIGLAMLLSILACSQIPKEEPPLPGHKTERIVLAEVYTQTG